MRKQFNQTKQLARIQSVSMGTSQHPCVLIPIRTSTFEVRVARSDNEFLWLQGEALLHKLKLIRHTVPRIWLNTHRFLIWNSCLSMYSYLNCARYPLRWLSLKRSEFSANLTLWDAWQLFRESALYCFITWHCQAKSLDYFQELIIIGSWLDLHTYCHACLNQS